MLYKNYIISYYYLLLGWDILNGFIKMKGHENYLKSKKLKNKILLLCSNIKLIKSLA